MYKKNKHIHFMGIGGIGMSGIAAILRQQGYTVSGCDLSKNSKTLDWLRVLGCNVHTGHSVDHIENADILVYSSAISMDHPEITAALRAGIPVIPRAIMLAELMRTKYSIAISGSHGKTTTTSMISHILTHAGLDPTIVIGGVLKNLSTHARLGNGDLLVAEADESDRSLLYLNPCIAIVTNIDAEHLDTYKDLDDVKETFKNFLARLPFYGKALVCVDDPNVRDILPKSDGDEYTPPVGGIIPLAHIPMIKYGLSEAANKEVGMLVRGEILEIAPDYSVFRVYKKNVELGAVTLHMPGEHNVLNALAAIGLSLELDVSFSDAKKALESFKGVERRFEFKGYCKGAEIFDDYGHHPTEIEKTLLVANRRAKNKLHVLFQPHRYTRTAKLWDDFINVFANAQIDTLFLTDIYPASEAEIPGITSERLSKEILSKNPNITIRYLPLQDSSDLYEEIAQEVRETVGDGDLFITIGAGRANCVGKKLLE